MTAEGSVLRFVIVKTVKMVMRIETAVFTN